MRVYQTIHKYPIHIEKFEERFGNNLSSNNTFSELQKLIIEDGYASAFILQPALKGKSDEVFFTIWDYERLQFLWADEHNIRSKDLSVIKKAQIDWFKPDVFYNHSAFCDDDFIDKYKIDDKIITVCWCGFIQKDIRSFLNYDIRVSLHRPIIDHWHKLGLRAYELQPSFVNQWSVFSKNAKTIDVLFYGQTLSSYFSQRNRLFEKLLSLDKFFKIQLHLTLQITSRPLFNVPILRNLFKLVTPSKVLRKRSFPPIYGQTLYEIIGRSKYTLNGYGNFNENYRSNMRVFEALGCGSLLISEEGIYPEGFEEGKHYIGYKDAKSLLKMIPSLIKNYTSIKNKMEPYIQQIIALYSKENQWNKFRDIVNDFEQRLH